MCNCNACDMKGVCKATQKPNYVSLRQNIQDIMQKGINTEIWLSENTANAVIAEAKTVKFEDDKIVMTFMDGTFLSIANHGRAVCGTVTEAFWTVIHYGEYNRFPYNDPRHRSISIL